MNKLLTRIENAPLPIERKAKIFLALARVALAGIKILDRDNLLQAFIWEDTPQGHSYWCKINIELEEASPVQLELDL